MAVGRGLRAVKVHSQAALLPRAVNTTWVRFCPLALLALFCFFSSLTVGVKPGLLFQQSTE